MVVIQVLMEASEVRSSWMGWTVLVGWKEGRDWRVDAAVCPLVRVRVPR